MRELLLVHGHLVALGFVIAAAFAGGLLERGLRVLQTRLRWRARMAPKRSRRVELGAVGRFVGVLRIEGEAAQSFEGHPCAAATAAARAARGGDFACTSTRADRLVLDVDGQRLVLMGELELIAPGPVSTTASRAPSVSARIVSCVGTELAWPFDDLRTELRRVHDGERVEVSGRIERLSDGSGGYRVAASGYALHGQDGALLMAPRAPRTRLVWGAGAAALAVLILMVGLAEAEVPSTVLISPIHRTDAVFVIMNGRLADLSHEQLEARLVLLEDDDHAGRAATLRQLARMHDAVAEAELGSDVASAHEAFLTRLHLPRGAELVEAWWTLVSRMDAACEMSNECPGRERSLDLTRTPVGWGLEGPNPRLLGVLFSAEEAHVDGGLTLLMGRGLLRREGTGRILGQLRARWLLEYAAVLIQLGADEEAAEALNEVERSGRLLLRRDAEELRRVMRLRTSLDRQGIRCTGCDDPGWCPSRVCDPELVRSMPGDEGWSRLPFAFTNALRWADGAGRLPKRRRWEELGAREVEYARWYMHRLGFEAHGSLVVRLVHSRWCESIPRVAGVIRDMSRAQGLGELGARDESVSAQRCAERSRRALLDDTEALLEGT